MKYCSNCGAELVHGAQFCTKCGKPITQGENENNQIESEHKINKKAVYVFLSIVGVLLLVAVGIIFYSEYSNRRAIRLVQEHLIADSLEAVREDSLEAAKQMEQERIVEERFAKFKEKLSFENFLALLNNYNKVSYAQKCGLDFIYKEIERDGDVDCDEYVYGYDVEKGDKEEYGGYEIRPKSNHACYFKYNLDTSTSASMRFKNKNDAQIFFDKAKEYGLIHLITSYGGDEGYFIPLKKISKVLTITNDDYNIYEESSAMISTPDYNNGWYIIHIGLDF